MSTVNLGILAHVDAGKTSLTERLLFAAGVIDSVGRVDDGSTQTDSLALERQRGITIKSAVASFAIGDVTVNLIDTPGHPDFIAEVERALSVLDGAVLVISAVEGVQAQTRVLFRALHRLRIPTLLFVNKIDRRGADCARVVRTISDKLSSAIVVGESRLTEVLAEHDDTVLAAYVDGRPVPDLRAQLVAQTRKALVHPVFFGSAITGAGVPELMAGIAELLPAGTSDADGPLSGTVFKVERGSAGEKIAYVRLFSGTVRVRDQLRSGKVTAIESGPAVTAGQIGKLWGLTDVRIGDAIGELRTPTEPHFSPPTLETVVVPGRREDRGALHSALTQLAEQDPLINLRQDDVRGEIFLSLYGEVQKEVIQATLADDFGVAVTFRETTTLHIERPVGIGTAMETINKAPNPFLATIGLRVEPGDGITFRLGIELGSLPMAFIKAVEETVTATLRQGLHGWQVTDCTVTLVRSGYWAKQSRAHGTFDKSMSSTAGDFRNLTPLVLMAALRDAGTQVYEPMHRFHLDVPADTLGAVLPVLIRTGAVPLTQSVRGSSCLLAGDVPAARVHELQRQLPSLTRGEGMLDAAFDHHQPVRGTVPTRSRSDHNPLNRKEYLLHVVRRV
jgi:ribosomal protection tetracycline resistance protein